MTYNPDYAIHPGETVKYLMIHNGLNKYTLAKKMCCGVKLVDDLFDGKIDITGDIALTLADVFDINEQFWLKLQANYYRDIQEKNE